jgi:sporulation protein YtfJ
VPGSPSERRPDAIADAPDDVLNDPRAGPAAEKAKEAAAGGPSVQLAERLGQTASASAVFGAPVERADITVIPVARARYGFGAGTGDDGTGGGGGVSVTPVGWIEMSAAGSRFKPLRPGGQVVFETLAALGLLAAGVALGRASRHDGGDLARSAVRRLARRVGRRIIRKRLG